MNLRAVAIVLIIFYNHLCHSSRTVPKWKHKTHGYQSPINIITSEAIEAPLPDIRIDTLNDITNTSTFFENDGPGHTIKLSSDATYTLSGGPLSDVYEFEEMHFHFEREWKGGGSEHKIDGKSFDMEVHFVFFKRNLKTFKTAVHNSNGLAVIAVLYSFDVEDNDEIDFSVVEQAAQFRGNFIFDDFLPLNIPLTKDYFTYDGSLTTPPYSENVKWIVFRNPLHVRRVNFPFESSRRGVQSVGDRSVYLIRRTFKKPNKT
ncbi:hypothetical protein HA402_008639 [Bradysia odoriphaga]|nr:hypothetical protein HA402_008639 [Bradysia odoriphaga]